MLGPNSSEGVSMLLTADQHRRLAEVYEEAAAEKATNRKIGHFWRRGFGCSRALPRRRRGD
jgi:hypothetical protein